MSLCLWKIWNCYIYTLSFRRQVVTRRKVLLDEMKWIIQRCEGLVKIINENNEGFSSFAVHCRCLAVEFDIQSKCRSQIHRKQWRMHFCSKIIWEFREKQQVRIIESEWWVLHLFKILSTWNCVSIVPVAKKLHRIQFILNCKLFSQKIKVRQCIYILYTSIHIYTCGSPLLLWDVEKREKNRRKEFKVCTKVNDLTLISLTLVQDEKRKCEINSLPF